MEADLPPSAPEKSAIPATGSASRVARQLTRRAFPVSWRPASLGEMPRRDSCRRGSVGKPPHKYMHKMHMYMHMHMHMHIYMHKMRWGVVPKRSVNSL